MASKLKTQEVILQSPNGLVEKTLTLGNDGIVTINAQIKQDGYYIVESGSNTNGYYTKFADGTLIMYTNLSGYGNFTGALNTIRWTFPIPAVGYCMVQATARDYANTWFYVYMDVQNTYADVVLGGTRYNYTTADVLAIGRWK